MEAIPDSYENFKSFKSFDLHTYTDEVLFTFRNYPAPFGPTMVSCLTDFDTARQIQFELIARAPDFFIAMRHDGDLARFFCLTYEEALYFPYYCAINCF
jgi:hypothetical protein